MNRYENFKTLKFTERNKNAKVSKMTTKGNPL